jgi:hypothetical protein
MNQAHVLQMASRYGYTLPPPTQHIRDILLRHPDFKAVNAIMA